MLLFAICCHPFQSRHPGLNISVKRESALTLERECQICSLLGLFYTSPIIHARQSFLLEKGLFWTERNYINTPILKGSLKCILLNAPYKCADFLGCQRQNYFHFLYNAGSVGKIIQVTCCSSGLFLEVFVQPDPLSSSSALMQDSLRTLCICCGSMLSLV